MRAELLESAPLLGNAPSKRILMQAKAVLAPPPFLAFTFFHSGWFLFATR